MTKNNATDQPHYNGWLYERLGGAVVVVVVVDVVVLKALINKTSSNRCLIQNVCFFPTKTFTLIHMIDTDTSFISRTSFSSFSKCVWF